LRQMIYQDSFRNSLWTLRVHSYAIRIDKCSNNVHKSDESITAQEIEVDPVKVEAVTNWKTLTNAGEVRSFVGLAGYYRRFIEGFSKIAGPTTQLIRKGVKFQWTDKCEQSFQELKQRLITKLILTIPEDSEG
ncbi:uncharacterized protein LOC111386780, partial [Olea europaea var. sylvestris]|uniref:uncharacterized protein LOC111386780 n=1 Tax=Olea europaea var. sylvestris TaxID=158386 RepID=UPI000C1D0727